MTAQLSRRDMFRYTAVGLGSVALLGAAAGCTPDSGTVTPPGGGDPTDFSFATWGMSEEASKPILGAAINAFAKKKGVSVATPTYPYNDYLNQLTLQVRGGQFSGAAQLDVAWLAGLAALGKLRDLGSLTEGRGYIDAGLKAGQIDGKQVGLPWTIAAIGLLTNTELLEKAKVTTPPTTLEEFEEALRAIKGLGGGVIPYAASTKTAQLKDIQIWMQTFGSTIIDGDKCTIGDEASVDAVTWYKKLFDEGLIAPDIDRAAARTLFAQGRTAMYDDAPVGKPGVIGSSPDADLDAKMSSMTRPVQKSGDTPREALWGHIITVVEGEGAETAAEFAQWITSDDAQTVNYFTKLALPPTTEKSLASDAVKSDTFISDFSERVTKDATGSPLWKYPQYAQMDAAISEQVQAVLIGQSLPKDAMKTAGEAVQKLVG